MRDLVLISAQPDDLLFAWQIQVQLNNFRRFGYSDKARILVFCPSDRMDKGFNPIWKEVEKQFPEAKFFYYLDTQDITKTFIKSFFYSPLIRPHILARHFKEFPELKEKAIFYHDSDIIFTKYLDFTPFLEDEVNYLSDTSSYIGAKYFYSKEKDVRPEKLPSFKKRDILAECLKMFDLDVETAIRNQEGSGGAQYLLKNIDAKFWNDVFDGCLFIRLHLSNVNRQYMKGSTSLEIENNGYQSWCADMWSVLWNLWKRGGETKCPEELKFVWRDTPISEWGKFSIYHDAGTNNIPEFDCEGNVKRIHKIFDKSDLIYKNGEQTPFENNLDFVSPHYCSFNYVKEIEETKAFLTQNSN